MDPRRKPEADEEEQASFLPHSPRDSQDAVAASAERNSKRRKTTWYLRLLLDIAMAATIIFLLFFRSPPRNTIRRTPVPTCRSCPTAKMVVEHQRRLDNMSDADLEHTYSSTQDPYLPR